MEADILYKDTVETLTVLGHIRLGAVIEELSPGEYGVLRLIPADSVEYGEESGISASCLAKKLGVSAPAVSRLLSRLEDKGFIYRKVEACDRRNVKVCITESGIEKRLLADENLKKLFSCIYDEVGREDMERFLITARKISDVIGREAQGN